MPRAEQIALIRDKLSELSRLSSTPYVSIRLKIMELSGYASEEQLSSLLEGARALEKDPKNIADWNRFKELSQ